MADFQELKRLAEGHAGDMRFTPARRVTRTARYRDAHGARLGMPPEPVEDPEMFEDELMAGLEKTAAGSLSGFGNFLVNQGRGGEVDAAATSLPEGGAEVAEQDLYEDGTPGKGTELKDGTKSFEDLRNRETVARRTVAQWQSDLKVLESRFGQLLAYAQQCADAGNADEANLWDRKAVSLGHTIETLRIKLMARRGYEQALPQADKDEYEELPSGLGGFDNLEDQLGVDQ